MMNIRENANAILHYENYDRMPIVSFGYWGETVQKWAQEGHITQEEADGYCRYGDNPEADRSIMKKLGFDFNWGCTVAGDVNLRPPFPQKVLEEHEDGSQVIRDSQGLIVMIKPGIVSIPAEIGTTLMDREAWEKEYLPRLQWEEGRVCAQNFENLKTTEGRETPVGLHCGSLMGYMRNLLGVEQLSYLYADDEDLYVEIIDTLAGLCYRCTKEILETGAKFDFAHFWEDICFKNGPLVTPSVFDEYVGPHYRKITELLLEYGVDIVSVDCDGMIDSLIPTWLNNGVNTMFPIEVGTWNASLAPWREKYGKKIRGVGGMNKTVFARDYAAVDAEVERLRRLMDLGGYIPCPDHRIAPDAKFENVQYYCEKMNQIR